jgi:hypothetical protein
MGPAVLEEALRDIFFGEIYFTLTFAPGTFMVKDEEPIIPLSSVIFPIILGLPSLTQLYIPTYCAFNLNGISTYCKSFILLGIKA